MADAIKFTEEELNSIKELQNKYNKTVFTLGQIALQNETLANQKKQVMSNLETVKKEEDSLAKSLNAKYGVGSLDLETGTFTPQK